MSYSYPEYARDLGEEMLAMPPDQLVKASRYPLRIVPTKTDLYRDLAREMADEIAGNNAKGEPTRWILPVGPKSQYPLLAEITNKEQISWKNVWAFHMDEWLDWQGREVPETHPLSFRGFCQKYLYDLIETELLPPKEQIIYPTTRNVDAFSEKLEEVGGADTTFAGFGYRGHLAFNEPPSTRWHHVTAEEMAASKTRIVPLLDDTIVALSHRMLGGWTGGIPRMALTCGMADIIASRRVHLLTDGGAWKRYILRAFALTTGKEANLPVTLLHDHPNVHLTVDADSALPIASGMHP